MNRVTCSYNLLLLHSWSTDDDENVEIESWDYVTVDKSIVKTGCSSQLRNRLILIFIIIIMKNSSILAMTTFFFFGERYDYLIELEKKNCQYKLHSTRNYLKKNVCIYKHIHTRREGWINAHISLNVYVYICIWRTIQHFHLVFKNHILNE